MGLEEKRWLATERETILPQVQQTLREIVGAEITYEVDWESFADDLEALQNLEHQGFGRINDAFRSICRDTVGRDAVRGAVHSVRLVNVRDAAQKALVLADGTFHVTAAWGADAYFTDTDIERAVSSAL